MASLVSFWDRLLGSTSAPQSRRVSFTGSHVIESMDPGFWASAQTVRSSRWKCDCLHDRRPHRTFESAEEDRGRPQPASDTMRRESINRKPRKLVLNHKERLQ